MKVKIIKKSIKEGIGKNDKPYCFKTLFVSVSNPTDANLIAIKLCELGADKDRIGKFIKANDYNGTVSYQFNLKCSSKAFDLVSKYGILDVNIENLDFDFSENFTNCNVKIVSGIEQIDGYEASSFVDEDEVKGFNFMPKDIQSIGDGSQAELNPVEPFGVDQNSLTPQRTDLPF